MQLHNGYASHASPNIVRIIGGAGDEMCVHSFGVENVNEENIWKTRHRWEENVERYLKEIRCELDVNGLGLQSNGRT